MARMPRVAVSSSGLAPGPPYSRGKKKPYTAAPVQNFSLPEKTGVHRGKISVVDMFFFFFLVLYQGKKGT